MAVTGAGIRALDLEFLLATEFIYMGANAAFIPPMPGGGGGGTGWIEPVAEVVVLNANAALLLLL